MKYAKVCEEEDEQSIELPLEDDNTLLLSTLTCQFSKATGLKYKSKDTGIYRGVRFASDRFYSPPEGWDTYTYSCVLLKDNKRKGDDDNHSIPKTKKIDNKKCTDLIVLNIPWRTDDEALRMYFAKFGEVVMVQVKREPDTMKSKGYAFIRFAEYDAQVMCLAEQHCIDNRWCEVKVPYSKMAAENTELRNKIHVGRLSEAVTADVLRSFFNQYGKVESIYIPRPFRSFAFVTFEDEGTAQTLLGRELKINDDCMVTISAASPKMNHANQKGMNGGNQGYGHWNSYDDMFHGALDGSGTGLLGPIDVHAVGADGRSMLAHHQRGRQQAGQQQHKLVPGSPQMAPPPDWPAYLQQQHALHAAANHHHHHRHPHQQQHQQHSQQHGGAATGGQYPTAADISQNTSAMAALNIINNPTVVAAIMSAAAARAQQQQQGDVVAGGGPQGPHLVPAVSSGLNAASVGGFMSATKPDMQSQTAAQQQHAAAAAAAQQQQQQQTQHQFLYSHIANQSNWGY